MPSPTVGPAGGADCPTARVSVPNKLGRSKFLMIKQMSVPNNSFNFKTILKFLKMSLHFLKCHKMC